MFRFVTNEFLFNLLSVILAGILQNPFYDPKRLAYVALKNLISFPVIVYWLVKSNQWSTIKCSILIRRALLGHYVYPTSSENHARNHIIQPLTLPSSKSTSSQTLKGKMCTWCVVKIGCTSIFHLSKLWKSRAPYCVMFSIFLVRLQGKFDIHHSWEWKD